jgi:hypothetical protein
MLDLSNLPFPVCDIDLLRLTQLALVQDAEISAAANRALDRFYSAERQGAGVMARRELFLDFEDEFPPPFSFARFKRACTPLRRRVAANIN